MNYGLTSYCTVYKCSGDIEIRFKEDACFSSVFSEMCRTEIYNCEYTVRIYKGETKAKCYKDNNCFLTKDELNYFINCIKRICKFSFIIDEKEEYLDVIVKIKGKKVIHKFILTWIRYCYEHPANFCVKYAFKLKDKFKKQSFFSLVNLIESTLCSGMRNCHSLAETHINRYSFGFKLSDIKKQLNSCDSDQLFIALKSFVANEYLGTLKQNCLEDWEKLYEDGFLIEKIKDNYKVFKKIIK